MGVSEKSIQENQSQIKFRYSRFEHFIREKMTVLRQFLSKKIIFEAKKATDKIIFGLQNL